MAASAIAVLQVHELAPVELGVLQDGGLLAPFGMIVPEFLADVRQFDPGVDQNAVAMAGVDEVLQVFVAFGIGVVEMPGRDVQGADAGFAPALGEIIGIGARPVGIIEKGPQAGAAEGGPEAQVGQRLHQVGEAFVAVGAGIGGDPQDGAGTEAQSGDERRASPAVFGEDARFGGDFVAWEFEGVAPDDRQGWVVDVDQMNDGYGFRLRAKAEAGGEGRGAFQNERGAVFDPAFPVGGSGSARGGDEDVGRCGRRRDVAD